MGSEYISVFIILIDRIIFAGYGLYTLLWVIVSLIYKNNNAVNGIDKMANTIAAISGLAFFILWITGIVLAFNDAEQYPYLLRRITGLYAFGFWLPPVLLILASQLLWVPFARKQKLIRLIVGFLLFLSIEKFTILTVSLHRDYMPSSWATVQQEPFGFYGYSITIIVDLLVRLLIYTVLSLTGYFIQKKIKRQQTPSNT